MDLPLSMSRFTLQELSSQDSFNTLEKDVRAGLLHPPRSLPPKYFYDEEGSKLFEAICKTDDYYPTRTEHALLVKHVEEIIEITKPKTCIELGAGASTKTELLISSLCEKDYKPTYITIDVCKEVLVESANRLLKRYPSLQVRSVVGEYGPAIISLPHTDEPNLFIFIGSSIGNFTNLHAIELLNEVANKMNANDYFLLGMDRVKDKVILEQAYDDSEGVTAKFNLNVLQVLNNKLGANFNLEQFSHQAIYNEKDQQIEMYLESKQCQKITFSHLDETIELGKDEIILTEISRKYTKSSIQQLLSESRLVEEKHFQPENEFFSLVLAKKV